MRLSILITTGAFRFTEKSSIFFGTVTVTSIANQLHELGYAAFVLRYRSFLNASDNAPLYDIANAVKYLTENADQFGVQRENYALMGFSSGGHIVGLIGSDNEKFGYKAFGLPQPAALLLAFVVGGVVAGIFGFLVGIPVLRLSGDYLAIVTLAFGEIVKNFMNACNLGVDSKGLHFSLKDTASLNLDADGKVLINGAMGITGIKKASTFTIGIVLVIITLAVILNLVNSRAGRAITSIRDNEIAARSVSAGP